VLTALLSGISAAALGQNAGGNAGNGASSADQGQLQEIVVTGTLIRGQEAPVGEQLTTVGNVEIQATGATNFADVLATVPMLNSFNIAPQGGQSEFNSGGSSTPALHGLPGTATLVLIDGHRAVGDTPLLNVPDPSSIPPMLIDHIEVLADGGSATYGSDAVAGVINIITKKNFDGAETSVSGGIASPYNQDSIGQMFGKTWSGGSALIAGTYAANSDLRYDQRSFYQTAPAGLAYAPITNCTPPNVTINGTNYTNPGMLEGPENTCDPTAHSDVYNQERRYALMGNVYQDIGDRVHLVLDAKYTDDLSKELIPQVSNETITLPNTNPFFTLPAGVSATSETVAWNTGNLNTPLYDVFRSRSGMVDLAGTVDLGHTWELVTDLDYSWSSSSALNSDNGGVDITALNAAVNGTTTSTALDPFGNRTNPKVAAAILDYPLWFYGEERLYDYNLKLDGTIWTLPGGDVKLAVGYANRHEEYEGSDPIGVPGQSDYTDNYENASRLVNAGFGQLAVPIVGSGNAMPGIQRFNLSVAGRYDRYSDFGGTTNPKYGIDWTPIDGYKFRASYGTSFHAPQLADIYGIDTRAGGIFPSTPPPGYIVPAGEVDEGAYIAGGRLGLQPEKAKNASFGVDLAPPELPGFKATLTYWMVRFSNEVQIPVSFNLNLPSLESRFIFLNPGPGGVLAPLTPAQISTILAGIRLTGPLTEVPIPPVWEITDARRANIGATAVDGWDFDFSYRHPFGAGNVISEVSGEWLTQYESNAGPGTPYQNNLTNGASEQSSDTSAYNVIPWHVRWTEGYQAAAFYTQAALNYTGHYNFGYQTPSGNTTVGAIEWVAPFVTVDWMVSYQLPDANWITKNMKVQFNINNINNEHPPVIEAATGFTALSASPLGRLFMLSLDKRW
jgi:iron complex outermembrane receptor protein